MKFAATLLFQRPRRRYLQRMLSGLRDGLLGRDGPAPP
jgi:rhamnosyltransferase